MLAKDAHPHVLMRDQRRAEIKVIADELCPIMIDLVNEGTWILREAFTRCDKQSPQGTLAIPLICHSQLEMLDAMSELCKECIVNPAKVLLRSMHESYFYCRFLDQHPAKFEKLSLAYLYELHRQYMKIGRRLEQLKGEDSSWIEENIKKLSEHGFKEIIEEHQRTKKKFCKVVLNEDGTKKKIDIPYQWYSLFDGPANLSELTTDVMAHVPKNEEGGSESNNLQYAILTQTIHANDLFLRMSSTGKKGTTAISSFRTPSSAQDFLTLYSTAVIMTMYCLHVLLRRNCTNHRTRGIELWIKNLQPRLHKVQRFGKSTTTDTQTSSV